jgi:hypothetical protein
VKYKKNRASIGADPIRQQVKKNINTRLYSFINVYHGRPRRPKRAPAPPRGHQPLLPLAHLLQRPILCLARMARVPVVPRPASPEATPPRPRFGRYAGATGSVTVPYHGGGRRK